MGKKLKKTASELRGNQLDAQGGPWEVLLSGLGLKQRGWEEGLLPVNHRKTPGLN